MGSGFGQTVSLSLVSSCQEPARQPRQPGGWGPSDFGRYVNVPTLVVLTGKQVRGRDEGVVAGAHEDDVGLLRARTTGR
jgi:hypothetical protein